MLHRPTPKTVRARLAWLLCLIPLLAVIAFGQTGNLEGIVRDSDTNNPIDDVVVILEEDTSWTDINGNYQFTDVPIDTYQVRAEKYSYAMETDSAVITAGITTELDFFLRPVPIIRVDISSLELIASAGQTAQESFTITNNGLCDLNYELEFLYAGMTLNVLLVDDDGGPNNGGNYYHDVQQIYMDALDEAGMAYDLYVTDWSTGPEQPGPTVSEMEQYDLVIWFTGECWGLFGYDTLTPEDESNLGLYLDEGGSLFLSSQDYLYASYPDSETFDPGEFPYDYLGVDFADQDRWTYPEHCEGEFGTFAQGMYFTLQSAIPSVNLWADWIEGDGDPLLNVFGHSVTLHYEADEFKSVFSTLSFEALVDTTSPSTKAEFLQALEEWFLGELPGQSISDNTRQTNGEEKTNPLTDDPWMTYSPEIGAIEPCQSQLVTLSFDMPDTAQASDIYEGLIVINNNSLANPVNIPVFVYISSDVLENTNPMPTKFTLHQNYPNPFNPTTNIRFDLPQSSHVNVTIYNVLGQNVTTLIDGKLNAGTHQVNFDGSHLTSGLYFYSINASDYSDVKKMLLLK